MYMSHELTAITAPNSMIRAAMTAPVHRALRGNVRRGNGYRRMSWLLALILIIVAAASIASSQVLTPAEIKDPDMRSLQQQ